MYLKLFAKSLQVKFSIDFVGEKLLVVWDLIHPVYDLALIFAPSESNFHASGANVYLVLIKPLSCTCRRLMKKGHVYFC